ncbi:hypothetical protein ACVWU4_000917 [Campylobacter coli]
MSRIFNLALDNDIRYINSILDSYKNNIVYDISLKEYDIYSELVSILDNYELPNNEFTRALVSYIYSSLINYYINTLEHGNEIEYEVAKLKGEFLKHYIDKSNSIVFNTIEKNFNEILTLITLLVESKLADITYLYKNKNEINLFSTLYVHEEHLHYVIEEFLYSHDYEEIRLIFPCKFLYNKNYTGIELIIGNIGIRRI